MGNNVKVPEWKLACFDWLPLDDWNPKNLIGPDTYCKICDERIPPKEQVTHIRAHINQKKQVIARQKKEAEKRRLEAMRLAREARKAYKEEGGT